MRELVDLVSNGLLGVEGHDILGVRNPRKHVCHIKCTEIKFVSHKSSSKVKSPGIIPEAPYY
ncbi:hypothetical protein D3C79_976570 [compost metagenome]